MEHSHASGELAVAVGPRDHARGAEDAPVTIVEYGDYECPYCGRTHPLIKRLLAEMPDVLRFVFRHLPQNSVHPHAAVAAQAAEAAAAQGKFWQMHDLMFDHQQDLGDADLVQYALKVGLEVYRFEADLASERHARRIREDRASAQASGAQRTPTLFINGRKYEGQLKYESLAAAVRAELALVSGGARPRDLDAGSAAEPPP